MVFFGQSESTKSARTPLQEPHRMEWISDQIFWSFVCFVCGGFLFGEKCDIMLPDMKKYITSNPNILGGKPVITGTRIPVDQILFLLKEGFTIEAINDEYPQLSKKAISGIVEETVEILNKHASQVL